jgi:hypothetical protein
MKKLSLAIALFLIVCLTAVSASAAWRVLLRDDTGKQKASTYATETTDGLKICDQADPTSCALLSPADLATGATTTLFAPHSVSALASALTSSITGTTGATVISGPTLTIDQPGTYSLSSNVTTSLGAATLSAYTSAKCWLYRTNNTPGAISNADSLITLPSMTTVSVLGPTIAIPPVSYTTANSDDAIQVYCSISANPGAGEVDVTSVYMLGVRFK